MTRQASYFMFSSACSKTREEGTLTGVLVLVSSQVADFGICLIFFFCVSYAEMWFIYLLSWLSLVIQISFVTLAIGKYMQVSPASCELLFASGPS